MFEVSAQNGRDGLGLVNVKSSGNSRGIYGYQHTQVEWNDIDRHSIVLLQ